MDGHNFDFYKNIDNHKAHRQNALKLFNIDYDKKKYFHYELPILGFEDNSFDLVLSSHLLFVYDDRFSYEFHLNAIKEMLRVANKVQIFPLLDFQNTRSHKEKNFSPYVYRILEDLQEYFLEIKELDFEFQPRGNFQLVIQKKM
jgi:ubiquinone/menaquinone biosynthesis C-methylase UbiE